MRGTDMAVVISQSQNEVAEMAERGIDIRPIRKRMVEEDLEGRFKDAQDPLRIAFVCSMWTTGFDVPSCSTIYLDKPMRNQALMQTITRANRVFPGKNNGLIVGYVDVLSNLHKALAIYASTGALGQAMLPVEEKDALVDALRDAVDEIRRFCQARDVDLDHITTLRQFEWVEALKDVSDQLMLSDEETSSFLERATRVERLFKAILPDERANEFAPDPQGHPRRHGPHRRGRRPSRGLGRHGADRAAPRRVRRRQRLPHRLRGAEVPHGPQRGGLGRRQDDVRERPAAHRRPEAALDAHRADHQPDPAQPHARRPLRALSAAPRPVQRRQPQRPAVLRRARQAQPLAHRGGGARGLGRADRGAARHLRPAHAPGTEPHRRRGDSR